MTFLSFFPALRQGFLQWDDVGNIVNNPALRRIDGTTLRWMFTTHFQGPYQPLSWLSLALDAQVWGLSPAGWHFTNLMFHTLNALLFFWLLVRLKIQVVAAAAAALLFSVHPLRVESVAWVTERRDVLSGFFMLLSLHAYIRRARGISLVAFVAALLSKATTVGLVWGLVALDLGPLKRLPLNPRAWGQREYRKVWIEKLPYLGLALIVGVVNLIGYHDLGILQTRYSLLDRLVLFASNASFYLFKILWPHPLLPYYELPVQLQEISGLLALYGVTTVILTSVAVLTRRRYPGLLVTWICYLLVLAPMTGLGQNGQQMAADRYTYLASMPLSVLLGVALTLHRRWVAPVFGSVALLAVLTWRQTRLWQDDVTLWSYTLRYAPDTYLAHSNLGTLQFRAGQNQEASRHFEEAIRLRPTDVESRLNLGLIEEQRGLLERAETLYREALIVRPSYLLAANNLALVRAKQGDFKEAIARLQKLVIDNPDFAEAQFNLGVFLMREGDQKEGRAHLQIALRLQPDLAARFPHP